MNDLDEFQLDPQIAYLNHAAVAPWPKCSGDAVRKFADANVMRGATDYLDWLKVEQSLRQRASQLLNAGSPDNISLLKSTSEGLSLVAHGLEWQTGDNVVLFDCEFPSNRIVWESLQRYGVETIQVPLVWSENQQHPEEQLLSQCNEHTRLISVSSVQYADGFRVDIERIGAFCRDNNILFCVDAIQSLGALQFDVQACHADFVMADGHKWMLGPEGLALFYSRPEVRELIQLNQYGWHMIVQSGDYTTRDWQVASDGRRFECGSPNLLAANALNASLGLLLNTGMERVEKGVLANQRALRDKLADVEGLEILSSDAVNRTSGIVTFRPKTGNIEDLYKYLMKDRVICAPRGGGIRFSPHFYTPEATLDLAVSKVKEWLRIS